MVCLGNICMDTLHKRDNDAIITTTIIIIIIIIIIVIITLHRKYVKL